MPTPPHQPNKNSSRNIHHVPKDRNSAIFNRDTRKPHQINEGKDTNTKTNRDEAYEKKFFGQRSISPPPKD